MLRDRPKDLTRAGFADAAVAVVALVEATPFERWAGPGLGEWTARELLGHTLRASATLVQYSADVADRSEPAGAVEVDGPVAYYEVMLRPAGVHEQVAERGRQAGVALGDDLVAATRAAVGEALTRLAALADDAVCATPAGRMVLPDYLATRVVELGVHLLDLQRALGAPASLPASTAAVVLDVLAQVGARRQPEAVVLALTGRGTWPEGANLLH